VGSKRARVEQNRQGQPLNKKPLLGMPGITNEGLPKLPVDDILKMKGPDCTNELRKIKSAQDKAGLSNKHQILVSASTKHELQIRLVDYYYPSYDGITTVLLPKGCCDFDVEKLDDWMLKVTTIGKGFELFGVGSIILSINKEPLSTKYTNGGNLMDMACRLFKGEIKNTSTKFLEVVPYTPPITSAGVTGATTKSKSTAMSTASTDVEAPEEDFSGFGNDNHHDANFDDIEAEEPASKPPAEDDTNQSSEAESMNSMGAAAKESSPDPTTKKTTASSVSTLAPSVSTASTPSTKQPTNNVLPKAKSTEGTTTSGSAVTPAGDKQTDAGNNNGAGNGMGANLSIPATPSESTNASLPNKSVEPIPVSASSKASEGSIPLTEKTATPGSKSATVSSSLRVHVAENKETEKEIEGAVKLSNQDGQSGNDKENGIGSSNNNDSVDTTNNKSSTESDSIDTQLTTYDENWNEYMNDESTRAFTDAMKRTVPQKVNELIDLAKNELDKKKKSNEELLVEKKEAEGAKLEHEQNRKNMIQLADLYGGDTNGYKPLEKCDSLIDELKTKLSNIDAKLKREKMTINSMKEKFDKTYDEKEAMVKEAWTERTVEVPTFLDVEKDKWNDFWDGVMKRYESSTTKLSEKGV